jgi:hypothetical protein
MGFHARPLIFFFLLIHALKIGPAHCVLEELVHLYLCSLYFLMVQFSVNASKLVRRGGAQLLTLYSSRRINNI